MDYMQGNNEYVPNSRFNQAYAKAFTGYLSSRGIFRLSYEYTKMKPGMTVAPAVSEITERGRWNEQWYQNLDYHLLNSRNTIFFDQMKLGLNLAYQDNHRRLYGLPYDEYFKKVDARLRTFNYETKATITPSERSNFIIAVQGMFQANRNGDAPEHVLPDYNLNDISVSGLVQHDFRESIHFQAGLRFDNRFMFIPEQERHGHSHEEEHEEEHGEEEEEKEIMPELQRYYGNLSGSMGVTYDITEHLLLRANISSAYRTPSIAELTQDGEHGVRYEQGDLDLKSQRNYEADISFHYHSKYLLLDVAGFYNLINDYIFLSPTSDTTDHGELIYRYTQSNASLYGMEATIEILATSWLKFDGNYAYVRGKQSNGDNLPFIPQSKLRLGLKVFTQKLGPILNPYFTFDFTLALTQDFPAPFETTSADYNLLNMGAGIDIPVNRQLITLEVVVSNLLNTSYIDHLSTLKTLDYYNAGRNIMVNVRIPFSIAASGKK
jgi:iron complex outermembrane receptor protein